VSPAAFIVSVTSGTKTSAITLFQMNWTGEAETKVRLMSFAKAAFGSSAPAASPVAEASTSRLVRSRILLSLESPPPCGRTSRQD
jgi:hypothetical protein